MSRNLKVKFTYSDYGLDLQLLVYILKTLTNSFETIIIHLVKQSKIKIHSSNLILEKLREQS